MWFFLLRIVSLIFSLPNIVTMTIIILPSRIIIIIIIKNDPTKEIRPTLSNPLCQFTIIYPRSHQPESQFQS